MAPIKIVQHQLPAEQEDYDLRENAHKWKELAIHMMLWMDKQADSFIHIDDYMEEYNKMMKELKL